MKTFAYVAALILVLWHLVTIQDGNTVPSAEELQPIAGKILSIYEYRGKGSGRRGRFQVTLDQEGARMILVVHSREVFSQLQTGKYLEGKVYRRVLRNNLWNLLVERKMYGNDSINELWEVKIAGALNLSYQEVLVERSSKMKNASIIEAVILIAIIVWCVCGIWQSRLATTLRKL